MRTRGEEPPLRGVLIEAAERLIAERGLDAVKARDLAREAGCALGAIYHVFPNLDALILEVNLRTLTLFDVHIAQAQGPGPEGEKEGRPQGGPDTAPGEQTRPSGDVEAAVGDLIRLGSAYLAFAHEHRQRWRALFQHRMAGDRTPPDWYLANQARLFRHIEQPLHTLRPDLAEPERALLARTLFSATHGMVSLGLDEKLVSLPLAILRQQIERVVEAAGRGLAAGRPDGATRPPSG